MHVQASATTALPLDAAWQRLSDLSALSQWAPDVAGSPAEALRVGATRWARLYEPTYGKDVLIERVTDVDPRRCTFTYDILDGIGPLRAIRTTWSLDTDGPRTKVTVASDLEVAGLARLAPGMVRRAWQRQLHGLVDGFARWADRTAGDVEVLPPGQLPPEPASTAAVKGPRSRVPRQVAKVTATKPRANRSRKA